MNCTIKRGQHRRGVVIVVVLALSLMMVGLILSLMAYTRSDLEQLSAVRQHTQCRLMLAAACMYIQETSRIGWDDGSNPNQRREAFGWIDIRDGGVGPKTWAKVPLWSAALGAERWPASAGGAARPAWPAVGSIVRCPMQRWNRPPFAIAPVASPNPIQATNDALPDFGLPLATHPDPIPVFGDPVLDGQVLRRPTDPATHSLTADATGADRWAAWSQGDPQPIYDSLGQGWFRLYRDGPATFVATVGAGGTRAFRDWDEVVAAGAQGMFQADQSLFDLLYRDELRLWYRFEWSPAVGGANPYLNGTSWVSGRFEDCTWPDHGWRQFIDKANAAVMVVNQGGTIPWIQRLLVPPENGKW